MREPFLRGDKGWAHGAIDLQYDRRLRHRGTSLDVSPERSGRLRTHERDREAATKHPPPTLTHSQVQLLCAPRLKAAAVIGVVAPPGWRTRHSIECS